MKNNDMPKSRYQHILLPGPSNVTEFTSVGSGGDKKSLPERDRKSHGEYLRGKLDQSWSEAEGEMVAFHAERHGVYLEFIRPTGFESTLKSLENLRKGIRLCNVRIEQVEQNDETQKEITYATVYIPNDERRFFFDKLEEYLTETPDNSKPKNAPLIESIDDIRNALLVESFWQDDKALIPKVEPQWCEVWLRDEEDNVVENFEQLLASHNIESKPESILFPERSVKLVKVSGKQLANLTLNSDNIAEYRRAKETSDFWISQTPSEQAKWVDDLLDRLEINMGSQVSVCILDTGVNNGHPLIAPILKNEDCQAINSAWGTHDHKGHGTLMAGLVAYGDLQGKLESITPVKLTHSLESVKILPPPKQGKNDPEFWGSITIQGISLAEIQNPNNKRITCMAVTAEDTRDRGRPTSWSAAIDKITSGATESDGEKRLIILAVGNIQDDNQLKNYPSAQITDSIHDPAQAWNALTVGAYTQFTDIINSEYSEYSSVAGKNQLSPFSTTSFVWEDKWPVKPEVVFEGGNVAVTKGGFVSRCEDLSLLSTSYKPLQKAFDIFEMTSAATAQAAHFAATTQSNYPNYWPETIKALVVHSAEWPDELKRQFARNESKTELKKVLNACGYGVPSLERALYCASNSLTLVAQAKIQPFGKNKTNEMHLYDLPWPKEILLGLGETPVEMRVTLSYFIEPGPGEIGWKDRYMYPSHGLRFELNSPTESIEEFVKRINKAAREKDEGKPGTSSPSSHWLIGANNRDKGSLHSDIWKGTAADLAESNKIAVIPRTGWWRKRNHLKKFNSKTRYSLIVSIRTPEEDIDIYTPVKVQISSIAIQV